MRSKILVCDDNTDIVEFLSAFLTSHGFEVSTATGYTDFMTHVECVPPDLIVLDIYLPYKDGFFIAENLRRIGNTTPIIFMTAHASAASWKSSSAFQHAHLLIKPIDPQVLLERIYSVLLERQRNHPDPLTFSI